MVNGRFYNLIHSERPVLVDFYADWCSPCKHQAPVLKELKEDLKDAVRILKIDVDKNPLIATRYNIRNIPTLMVFKNGSAVWTGTGLRTKNELMKVLKRELP